MKLEEQLHQLVLTDKLDEAIEIAEKELIKLPATEFHEIIDSSFVSLKDGLISHVDNFYASAKKALKVKSFYVEMNGFSINTDMWFLELFAYKKCGDLSDPDWLADYDFYNELILPILGLEKLQAAFKDYHDHKKWNDPILKTTSEICEFLIILRLQQAFREVNKAAIERNLPWAKIPIFVTAHDYDLIYQCPL